TKPPFKKNSEWRLCLSCPSIFQPGQNLNLSSYHGPAEAPARMLSFVTTSFESGMPDFGNAVFDATPFTLRT
ncbi:MAG: hypothetical protein ABJR23_16225, partial [Paracoccaceae bacterium]